MLKGQNEDNQAQQKIAGARLLLQKKQTSDKCKLCRKNKAEVRCKHIPKVILKS